MKKALRVYLSGSLQTMFFEQYIKENADRLNIRGFMRKLEEGSAEIFIEGNTQNVSEMLGLCKSGGKHAHIRSFRVQEEKFQDFKDFKVLRI